MARYFIVKYKDRGELSEYTLQHCPPHFYDNLIKKRYPVELDLIPRSIEEWRERVRDIVQQEEAEIATPDDISGRYRVFEVNNDNGYGRMIWEGEISGLY